MSRIALATAAHYPDLSPDDQVLRAELVRRGVQVTPVIWDGDADWDSFDVVVARSIWDYHLKYSRFLEWLAALDASGARIHNPTGILRTNADKRYLLDLERKGVRITPTRVVEQGDQVSLASILADKRWQRAVVKPVVASTGYETWFVDSARVEHEEYRFAIQAAKMPLLVQEFIPGVLAGELSFVFIDGEYTHCILKQAGVDEFRVHIEHGGSVGAYTAPPEQIAWAESVVATLGGQRWTYARVDAVTSNNAMMLMEFELLDPELFFKYNAAAAGRLADALL